MKHVARLLVAGAVLGGFASGWALAQDEEKQEKKEDTLQKKQASLREAYRQFEDKLTEAANAFRKVEPEKAQRIQRAVDASRQAFDADDKGTPEAIWQHMQRIVD